MDCRSRRSSNSPSSVYLRAFSYSDMKRSRNLVAVFVHSYSLNIFNNQFRIIGSSEKSHVLVAFISPRTLKPSCNAILRSRLRNMPCRLVSAAHRRWAAPAFAALSLGNCDALCCAFMYKLARLLQQQDLHRSAHASNLLAAEITRGVSRVRERDSRLEDKEIFFSCLECFISVFFSEGGCFCGFGDGGSHRYTKMVSDICPE